MKKLETSYSPTSVLQIAFLFSLTFLPIHETYGQSKVDTIILKKGEVFDILLLNQAPNTEADLKLYFQKAFPVAKRMSYQPIPGFKVGSHTQGNLHPNTLILGKWDNLTTREAFLSQIIEEVPDFHEMRRKIWPFFGLRYFEIQQDLTLELNRSAYQVATAYWLESGTKASKFYKKWTREIEKMGGHLLIELKEGKSPFGYQYNPDFFVITSWTSEAAFKAFQQQTQKFKLDNIQHVNEFVLE